MKKELRFLLSSDMTISVELRGSDYDYLIFPVKEILTGKKEEEKKGLFFYIEEYLRNKPEEFSVNLFKEYQIASDTLEELARMPGLEPLNSEVFYRILDLIDIDDLYRFLVRTISVPRELKEEFVQDANGTLNSIQTYTRKEYVELILLSTMLRFVLPILGKYIYVKANSINKNLKEILFLPIFTNYDKFKTMPSFIKLEAFAAKAYEKEQTDESDAVRSILYGISKDETPNWLFASSLILGIMSVSTINDNDDQNIIKKIFNSILTSRIKKNTENSKIKDKSKTVGTKGNEETQESNSEACRVTTNITPGLVEELNWSASNPEFIIKQMPLKEVVIDKTIAKEAFMLLSSYAKDAPFILPSSTFPLLGWIFQCPFNHVEAYRYLRAKELYSVIAVAYSHLYINGFKDLALMIISAKNTQDDLEFSSFNNNSTNRSKIPDDIKKELDSFYSLKKNKVVGNTIEELSIPELGINELSEIMFREEYITMAKKEHIIEVKNGSSSPVIIANNNLKIRLAELLIFINKRDSKIKS